MKIFIAIPTKEKMMAKTVSCLINNMRYLQSKGIDSEVHFGEGTLVPRVRTALLNIFKKHSEYDYLIFIDSDQTFTQDTIYRLINSGKDIIGCPTQIRGGGAYNIYFREEGDINYKPLKEIIEKGIVRVDAIGFGLVCLSRNVCNFFDKIEMTNMMSEDIYFCHKAKELGFEIFSDNDRIMGHLVTMELK